jgi:hypothetical protein
LRPLKVMVATNWRWANRKAMIRGIVATTFPLISSDHSVRRTPWKLASPSWIVYQCSSLIAISGQIRSFQEPSSVKIVRVANAGLASGSTMRQNTPKVVQPSMRAASSSSMGSDRKNWRIKKMPKAVASHGTKAAASVSTSPSLANMM